MSQDEKAREALEIYEKAHEAAMIQLRMNLGLTPLEQKPVWNQPKYDLAKMDWREVHPSDPQKERFETCRKCGTEDYKNLFASIQSAGGFMQSKEYKFWIMQDNETLARRIKK